MKVHAERSGGLNEHAELKCSALMDLRNTDFATHNPLTQKVMVTTAVSNVTVCASKNMGCVHCSCQQTCSLSLVARAPPVFVIAFEHLCS